MRTRIYWLLGGLCAAGALAWWYARSRSSGASTDVVDRLVSTVTSTIRGIRNNNPTNMVDAGIDWQGRIGADDAGFLVFDTMTNGIRAAAINARNYSRLHGIDTVDGIVRRWSKTDQDAYSANVSAWLGVDPHDSIDLEDPDTLTRLLQGLARQEDGAVGELLVDSQIASVVANV